MSPQNNSTRIPAVDAARGAALLAMFAYHLTWDFASLGLIDRAAPYSAGMRLFSHVIASSFLFLAGLSLVLAKARWNAPAFWKNWALVAAAAALVSGATLYTEPERFIFFGILHCIALAMLLAVALLSVARGWILLALMGAIMALAPEFYAAHAFDSRLLAWTGLYLGEPTSVDFRPILPWGAPLLLGAAFARSTPGQAMLRWATRWRAQSAPARLLRFGGRHSLLVYLVHQPVFIGALTLWISFVHPAAAPPDEAQWRGACVRRCEAAGVSTPTCANGCDCIAREMKSLNLWGKLRRGALDANEQEILASVARGCAGD